MLVRSAWTGPPAPARKLALAGTPAQPHFTPLQEKKHQARRLEDPARKVKVRRFHKVCRFQFRIQILRFAVITVRLYSFGHLDSVK